MEQENIPINELEIKKVIQKIKSNNPEEVDLINSILQMKPQNVTPGLELLASNMLLIIFETLNNLTINYLGENGEYYTRRLAASYFVIENLKKLEILPGIQCSCKEQKWSRTVWIDVKMIPCQ